ncbi:MAG: hypothetical protein KC800_24415 [Candidatus Eremiobacteraeota bacterium]|nr:hypothetical protein [Candidatus Eremiobacteraeota bacterium]
MVYAFLLILWLVNTFVASRLIAIAVSLMFRSAAGAFYRLNKRPDRGSEQAGREAGELVSGTGPGMVVAALAGVFMTLVEAWLWQWLC